MPANILTNLDFIHFITGNEKSLIQRENNKDVVIIKNKSFEEIKVESDMEFPYEIQVQDCTVDGNFEIAAGKYSDRFIFKRIEVKNIIITGGKFTQGLFINNCKVLDGIVFYKKENNIFFPASVSIENNSAHYISVNNLDFEYINFSQNEVSWIRVSNSLIYPETKERKLEHLFSKVKYFNFSLKEKSKLLVDFQEIDNLSFNGSLNSAEISMNMIKVQQLSIQEFTKPSSGILNLSRFRPLNDKSSVIIQNSFLGSTSFYDCDFASFKSFSVASSHFIDLIYANTTWPKKISIADYDSFSPSPYSAEEVNAQLRETFRQLKISASKQGDKLQEAVFYRNEMVYLNRTLSSNTHFTTKLSLLLSLISNNHKQNWILPIIWLFVLNIIFVLMMLSNGICNLHFNWSIFFNLLNPAHRFSDLAIATNFLNLFVDFSSRIFNGFLIYQIVTAFRKLS